ncbi:ACP phosphodiesterase [Zhongshania sp.]|uniref:acyl carrier protein phosphodiesterase n=1 Tax=Zhongshania sp. TaxID=1971902 RepID=UPI0035685320
MNYLAHFLLAEQVAQRCDLSTDGLLVGGLLGDFVKGPLRGDFPSPWETGIRLHRRIDALTDSHPLVSHCLEALPANYRRYGGIMLDVCFDHCLSMNWRDFHHQDIVTFTSQSYRSLLDHSENFPTAAKRQIRFLAQYDVLSKMDDWRNIEAMLGRIGQRVKRDNPLGHCGPELAHLLPLINQQFAALYPNLMTQLCEEFSPNAALTHPTKVGLV